MDRVFNDIDVWTALPHHQNIVTAYDLSFEGGLHFQITDFIKCSRNVYQAIEKMDLDL